MSSIWLCFHTSMTSLLLSDLVSVFASCISLFVNTIISYARGLPYTTRLAAYVAFSARPSYQAGSLAHSSARARVAEATRIRVNKASKLRDFMGTPVRRNRTGAAATRPFAGFACLRVMLIALPLLG